MGESFDDIDLGAKCFRYSFKQEEGINTQSEEIRTEETYLDKKPWWKFW